MDDQDNPKPTMIGYADTYNATPQKPTRESGSGRGVFLKNGIFLKGAGLTPLAPLKGLKTTILNTGFCPIYEGVKEAIFGEFFHQQGPVSSTRVLAVFDLGFIADDQKNYTGMHDQGLIIRVGDHARIAHYTDGSCFQEFQNPSGKCQPIDNWEEYKARFPIAELIQNHVKALVAAEFRRFWHGAMDAGNTKIRGGSLDFGSATFQPDTAPRFWLNPNDYLWFSKTSKENIVKVSMFGYEHLGVADNLSLLYPEFKIDVFNKELEQQRLIQLMEMFGFLESEARNFLANSEHENLIHSFYSSWWKLGKYFYWGNMDGRTSVTEPLSLIDVFSYLRNAVSSFGKMEQLPEIEINKPDHLKEKPLDSWQESLLFVDVIYAQYGVRIDSSNQLIFSSQKSKDEFLQEKALLNSKLKPIFTAFISHWQTHEKNIKEKINLLINTVAAHSMPFTYLSRGPLLESFKKAFADYKEHGNVKIIQDFIDKTVTINSQNADRQSHIIVDAEKTSDISPYFRLSISCSDQPIEMHESGLKPRSGADRLWFFSNSSNRQRKLDELQSSSAYNLEAHTVNAERRLI